MLRVTLLGLLGAIVSAEQIAPLGHGCLVSAQGLDGHISADSEALDPRRRNTLPSSFIVDVHFHIASTQEDEDLVTKEIVDAQWKVLHDSFSKYGINLILKSTERVVDDLAGRSFFVYEGPDTGWVHYENEEREYFKSTRKGGYDALNIHFFSKYSPGATGICTWPTILAEGDDSTLGLDGCQVSAMTMPGFTVEQGGFEDWNLGHLAVHEAGHWFGLNHTFTGGCSQPGDFVGDTPSQRTQIFGCPLGSDSCPDQPGLDPIHNFMGYTTDNWYVLLSKQRVGLLQQVLANRWLTIPVHMNLQLGRRNACLESFSTIDGSCNL